MSPHLTVVEIRNITENSVSVSYSYGMSRNRVCQNTSIVTTTVIDNVRLIERIKSNNDDCHLSNAAPPKDQVNGTIGTCRAPNGVVINIDSDKCLAIGGVVPNTASDSGSLRDEHNRPPSHSSAAPSGTRSSDTTPTEQTGPNGTDHTGMVYCTVRIIGTSSSWMTKDECKTAQADADEAVKRVIVGCRENGLIFNRASGSCEYPPAAYKKIDVKTFILDGSRLSTSRAPLLFSGFTIPSDGNVSLLFTDINSVIMYINYPSMEGQSLHIPMLTDNATRAFREYLMQCRTNISSAQLGCPITVTGRASICELQNSLGVQRDIPCIIAEDGHP
jgi:hypothetical protein